MSSSSLPSNSTAKPLTQARDARSRRADRTEHIFLVLVKIIWKNITFLQLCEIWPRPDDGTHFQSCHPGPCVKLLCGVDNFLQITCDTDAKFFHCMSSYDIGFEGQFTHRTFKEALKHFTLTMRNWTLKVSSVLSGTKASRKWITLEHYIIIQTLSGCPGSQAKIESGVAESLALGGLGPTFKILSLACVGRYLP